MLLDFDGPICSVFAKFTDREVADQLRIHLGGQGYDQHTADPFDILAAAARVSSTEAESAEKELARLEVRAAQSAAPTPGAEEAIRSLVASGHTITVVSNNSVNAVRAYLAEHGLLDCVRGISARADSKVERLKPDPYLLTRAINDLGDDASDCVMVGDSISDLIAGHRAGTGVIGYANKPGKHEEFETRGADAIITSMSELLGTQG
ncbi:HAD family hydrolase [Actinokineospora sp. HUAS TT18]|uniref:HAD family hydrolase n=1 Tax=Actinokineospora sp. HUAS TT18 TaxID=3447451 RepID=UPI003F523B2C